MPRIVITVPGRTPQPYRFQLDRQSVSLGRGSENDIVVDCPSVSVRHAVMERIEGGYRLRDQGSTNGIKLDGEVMETVRLRHGLSVRVGDVAFDFTLSDDEREALAREKPQDESPIVKEEPSAAPIRRPSASPRPVTVVQPPSTAASFFMTLLFLLLAAFAFFVGLSIRYAKDHNNHSLIQAMQGVPPPAAGTSAGGDPADGDTEE